jgi:hypothetical protein
MSSEGLGLFDGGVAVEYEIHKRYAESMEVNLPFAGPLGNPGSLKIGVNRTGRMRWHVEQWSCRVGPGRTRALFLNEQSNSATHS